MRLASIVGIACLLLATEAAFAASDQALVAALRNEQPQVRQMLRASVTFCRDNFMLTAGKNPNECVERLVVGKQISAKSVSQALEDAHNIYVTYLVAFLSHKDLREAIAPTTTAFMDFISAIDEAEKPSAKPRKAGK